jgi:hypothetical protein
MKLSPPTAPLARSAKAQPATLPRTGPRAPLDPRASRPSTALDGFEPGRARVPVALSDPGQALLAPAGSASSPPGAGARGALGRHANDGLRPGSGPDLLDVPGGAPPGAPALNAAPMPGFSAATDLSSFQSAQEARAGLLSAEVTTEATDTSDASGAQHITERTTTVDDDGSVTTDVQTHARDAAGNVKETQEVIRTAKDGSQQGHRSETNVTPDGKATTTRHEWTRPANASRPDPTGDAPPKVTEAESAAVFARLQGRVADPSSEHAPPPVDLERLSRGVEVRRGSTVNPNPHAEPTPPMPDAPGPLPRTPSIPGPEGTPDTAPTPRPAGGKPSVGPGGPRGR